MTELVTVDIGGTNARFAIATVQEDRSIELGEVVTLPTHAYASLRSAWELERVLVRQRVVIADAALARVDLGATQLFGEPLDGRPGLGRTR